MSKTDASPVRSVLKQRGQLRDLLEPFTCAESHIHHLILKNYNTCIYIYSNMCCMPVSTVMTQL